MQKAELITQIKQLRAQTNLNIYARKQDTMLDRGVGHRTRLVHQHKEIRANMLTATMFRSIAGGRIMREQISPDTAVTRLLILEVSLYVQAVIKLIIVIQQTVGPKVVIKMHPLRKQRIMVGLELIQIQRCMNIKMFGIQHYRFQKKSGKL